jgi:tetrahydromethanopterin S-methyltransferase subunit E
MSELSPQAQEVFWAFNRAASGKPDDWHYLPAIAAALRAAADQVVPQEEPPADFLDVQVAAEIDQRRATCSQLLAIADELETFAQ